MRTAVLPTPGVLTAPSCVSPVHVDGGTRFALEVDPNGFDAVVADGDPRPRPPEAFRVALVKLRAPTTREQDQAERERGGCVLRLPVPPHNAFGSTDVYVRAEIRGTRREMLTLYIEDVAFIRVGIESGQVRCELKARALWAEGYASVAARVLDLVLWWCTGHRCTLANAHAPCLTRAEDAPAWVWGADAMGWRVTGLEVCSDFTDLELAEKDLGSFVGFAATEIVRRFDARGEIATLNLGSRASPISLCVYNKTEQIADVKGGDDSTYRAAWRANGWNGIDPLRRVEFRFTGRALQLVDDETGEALDFRKPSALADARQMRKLWAIVCSDKRLVVRDNSTRIERCAMDARWSRVLAASAQGFEAGWRHRRSAHEDCWRESEKRARRDVFRSLSRFAALHDHADLTPQRALAFMLDTSEQDERDAAVAYAQGYRNARDPLIGFEIVNIGGARWNVWAHGGPQREPGDDDPDQIGRWPLPRHLRPG